MKGIFVMPPYQHQFVCLASSKKPGGRCVAGKIWGGPNHGAWIRPVSHRQNDSISDAEIVCHNGEELKNLDVATVTYRGVQNHTYQSENHVISHPPAWQSGGRVGVGDLAQLEDRPDQLWESGYHSTSGFNDRVHADELTAHRPTLYLIRPEGLSVRVSAEGAAWGEHDLRVRALFTYNGHRYELKVTDIPAERYFQQLGAGTHHPEGITYFTVSLGEIKPGTDYAYKLVAAIL